MRIQSERPPTDTRILFLFIAGAVALAVLAPLGVMTAPVWGQPPAGQSPATSAPTNHTLEQMEAAGTKMAFDVASVKPNKSADQAYSNFPLGPGDVYSPNGGFFRASNIPLITYIAFAFRIESGQMRDLQPQFPNWVSTDRFDIESRAQGDPTKDQMRLMMQSLLANRFKLAMHTENRPRPVYALVLAKAGKTGPQLQARPDDATCSAAAPDPGNTVVPVAPSPTSGLQLPPIGCHANFILPASAPGRVRRGGREVNLAFLANTMTQPNMGVDRPVIDRTGLSGDFDFSIEWSPALNLGAAQDSTPDDTGPTFVEALRDQLGLKLVPQTGPVAVIVLDHVQRPSEN